MTPNEKTEFLTPKAIGLAALIALAVVAVAAVVLLSPVSSLKDKDDAKQACLDASEWHYAEALKASPDAEYHFWAGAAAEKLAATGASCNDWTGA